MTPDLVPAPFALLPGEAAVFRKPPRLSTYDWTRTTLRVVAGPYKGHLWDPRIAPYAKGIMDHFDRPEVRKIFIIAPSQTTKTTIAMSCQLAEMSRKLCTCGYGTADERSAQRKFDEAIAPYVRSIKTLADALEVRNGINRTEIKFRDGSSLDAMWSGSEASMSAISRRIVVIDEEDAYQDRHAAATMEERVSFFAHLGQSKIIRVSKPRGMEDASTIWADAQAQAQVWYAWEAVCPACHAPQVMDDRHIKAVDGERNPRAIRERKLARYHCQACGYAWTDQGRDMAVRRGRWAAGHMEGGVWVPGGAAERPTVVAFHLRAWETILTSLSEVLATWWEAQGDPARLQRYDNNIKAVPYRLVTRETSESRIAAMIDPDRPPQVMPCEALALTCGIDVQMTGFWFVVRAWARSGESWLVDYGFLPDWAAVENLLFDTRYPVEGLEGATAPIWRAAMDIGGGKRDEREDQGWSKTDEIKGWLQANGLRGAVYGVKGSSRDMTVSVKATSMGSNPKIKAQYQEYHGKLPLFLLDTKALKDLIHYRLAPESSQPMRLHAATGPDYVRHIASEKKRVVKGKETWESGGRANHLLDCEVYAAACADPLWTPSLRLLADPVRIYETEDHEEKPRQKRERRRWW